MRIFITGGTGLVGSRLIKRLRERKHDAVVLTRRPDAARKALGEQCSIVEGDPMKTGKWMDAVTDCDAVVNLAGEGIFNRRWNDEFKKVLRDSRVKSTEHVVEALKQQPKTAAGESKVLVNASAIGYYGTTEDEKLTESSPHGSDVMAKLCVDWEKAAHGAEAAGVRVAIVRIGVVLDKNGGALAKLLTPFKLGAGGPVGSGKQWMSWIHHEDLTGILVNALENKLAHGPINGTAPNPVTNKQFGKALGKALFRPSFMPTPGFALKLMLGEVADVVLKGQRVLPKKALDLGYQFKYPEIAPALANILAW